MNIKKYSYNVAFACFDCQKSFKRAVDLNKGNPRIKVCPHCSGNAVNLGRNFKPPKSTDNKQWQKVACLYNNGFHFQKIRPKDPNYPYHIPNESIPYPKKLIEVKEFMETYKRFALEK